MPILKGLSILKALGSLTSTTNNNNNITSPDRTAHALHGHQPAADEGLTSSLGPLRSQVLIPRQREGGSLGIGSPRRVLAHRGQFAVSRRAMVSYTLDSQHLQPVRSHGQVRVPPYPPSPSPLWGANTLTWRGPALPPPLPSQNDPSSPRPGRLLPPHLPKSMSTANAPLVLGNLSGRYGVGEGCQEKFCGSTNFGN